MKFTYKRDNGSSITTEAEDRTTAAEHFRDELKASGAQTAAGTEEKFEESRVQQEAPGK